MRGRTGRGGLEKSITQQRGECDRERTLLLCFRAICIGGKWRSWLTVKAERGAFSLSLVACCQVSRILSCQVKLTTSRQDEEGGPAKLNLFSLPSLFYTSSTVHVTEHGHAQEHKLPYVETFTYKFVWSYYGKMMIKEALTHTHAYSRIYTVYI